MNEHSTELMVVKDMTPAVIFGTTGGVDAILAKIKLQALAQATALDISTSAGRTAIASLAHKVARSKTTLDKMGKDLGETHYKSWKAITGERSRIEKELDALKDEVRKPLTDWENVEKARIAGHEDALAQISALAAFSSDPSSEHVDDRIATHEKLKVRDWQEFAQRADLLSRDVEMQLGQHRVAALKCEADRAELDRLRREQAERQQRERDERIAAEAAERARIEAETKAKREADVAAASAKAEQDRMECERVAAEQRAAKAERDRIAAEEAARLREQQAAETAERRRLQAIEDERKRVADEKARTDAETARREADKKHRAKINGEVVAALLGAKLAADEAGAKAIVVAIARGDVPHTRISY